MTNIAKHDLESYVGRLAVKKIDDEEKLGDIIENAEDYLVKAEAIGKIRNQKILVDIVNSDKDGALRSTALYNILDEKIFMTSMKMEIQNLLTHIQYVME